VSSDKKYTNIYAGTSFIGFEKTSLLKSKFFYLDLPIDITLVATCLSSIAFCLVSER